MAWWRDELERLDQHRPPPEPTLEAIARELLPRGITGRELAVLPDSMSTVFGEDPDSRALWAYGNAILAAGAKLLRINEGEIPGGLGMFYGLVAAARVGKPEPMFDSRFSIPEGPFPKRLRPLTALASLAWRDGLRICQDNPERPGTPGRAWTLLRHRLTGRL